MERWVMVVMVVVVVVVGGWWWWWRFVSRQHNYVKQSTYCDLGSNILTSNVTLYLVPGGAEIQQKF